MNLTEFIKAMKPELELLPHHRWIIEAIERGDRIVVNPLGHRTGKSKTLAELRKALQGNDCTNVSTIR